MACVRPTVHVQTSWWRLPSIRFRNRSTSHSPNVRQARFQQTRHDVFHADEETFAHTPPPEGTLKLNRYFVELKKPLKLVLAYDDDSSQICVHKVAADCQLDAAGLVQPGDVLVRVDNLVVANGKWRPRQIGRLVVALNSSASPSVKLVFQRPELVAGRRPRYVWYAEGCPGEASSHATDSLFLPPLIVHVGHSGSATPGRPLMVSFHNTALNRASCMKNLRRSQAWRDATLHCIRNKPLLMFRARGAKDTGVGPQVVRPSKSFASELPASDQRDNVMANVVPFNKPAVQNGQDERRTATRTVRAFLPWVLLSIGRLDIADVRHVAIEFGLRNILEISIRLCDFRRPCLMTPMPGSTLDHLIECVAALHRHAIGQGLRARTARAPKGSVVMLHCARNMEVQAATVLAAYLHWHGCMSLQESVQLTQQACGCAVDTDLLKMATSKLSKESGMRRQTRKIVWPYGGNEVTLVTLTARPPLSNTHPHLDASANGAASPSSASTPRHRSKPGPPTFVVSARSSQSDVVPGGNGNGSPGSSGNGNNSSPGGAGSAQDVNTLPPGCSFYPMHRDVSGGHSVTVQVQPQRHPESLWYCFVSDGVLNIDPTVPHERVGDCIMNVMRGPQLQKDSASQLQLARLEAAMRALQFGWQVAAAASNTAAAPEGGGNNNGTHNGRKHHS